MAAEGGFVWDESFTAGTSLQTKQFFIMMQSAADTVIICANGSGSGGAAIGVLQNDPGLNQQASVRLMGRSKVSASGAIAVNDCIASTTLGQAITVTTTGLWCIGRAASASTAANQIIEAFIRPGWMWAGSTA